MTFKYLLTPVLSDGERALILLQMARVAYMKWAELGKVDPDWDALSPAEKERWGQAVRVAVRAMFSLIGNIVEEPGESS
jgi:hypothetical protein